MISDLLLQQLIFQDDDEEEEDEAGSDDGGDSDKEDEDNEVKDSDNDDSSSDEKESESGTVSHSFVYLSRPSIHMCILSTPFYFIYPFHFPFISSIPFIFLPFHPSLLIHLSSLVAHFPIHLFIHSLFCLFKYISPYLLPYLPQKEN